MHFWGILWKFSRVPSLSEHGGDWPLCSAYDVTGSCQFGSRTRQKDGVSRALNDGTRWHPKDWRKPYRFFLFLFFLQITARLQRVLRMKTTFPFSGNHWYNFAIVTQQCSRLSILDYSALVETAYQLKRHWCCKRQTCQTRFFLSILYFILSDNLLSRN